MKKLLNSHSYVIIISYREMTHILSNNLILESKLLDPLSICISKNNPLLLANKGHKKDTG